MTFVEVSVIVGKVVPYINMIGVLVGIYFLFQSKLNEVFQLLLIYFEISLVFNVSMELAGNYFGNNLILIPLFGFSELLFYTYFFSKSIFSKNKRSRNITLILGGIGLGYIIFEIINSDPTKPENFQTYARVVDALLVVTYSMIYLYNSLSNDDRLERNIFALVSGLLVYFSLNVILLLPINFMINEASVIKFYFWFAYTILIILFYIFITYILWKSGKTR